LTPTNIGLKSKTVDQTRGTKVHYLDQSERYNHRKIYNVEVVDWETHTDEPMQVVRPKCAQAYPPYFFLLVFGRSGIEKVVEARALLEEVQHLTIPFGEFWIIGRVSESGYRMLKLHPHEFWIYVDIGALSRKTREGKISLNMKHAARAWSFAIGAMFTCRFR
jgi:hypothetical protein